MDEPQHALATPPAAGPAAGHTPMMAHYQRETF